jgi:hypothetical protein
VTMIMPWPDVKDLPMRSGPRPRTTPSNPHQQLEQNAPREFQDALLARARALPGVRVEPSGISVPGARAFVLAEHLAGGPPDAFMVGREFAHLHPAYDGSLHAMLPTPVVDVAIQRGWAELHPVARAGWLPPTAVMIYGPRNPAELEVVWSLLKMSYAFARGTSVDP